jgi:hypothetical protein
MTSSIYDFLSDGIHALYVLIFLAGIAICLRSLSVSRWVKLILFGFIGSLASSTCSSLFIYAIRQDLTAVGFTYFQPVLTALSFPSVFCHGLIVLGLGMILWELKRQQMSRTQ